MAYEYEVELTKTLTASVTVRSETPLTEAEVFATAWKDADTGNSIADWDEDRSESLTAGDDPKTD